jgi:aspartyl aminopeptidase
MNELELVEYNHGLCDFLNESPTPFHAVKSMCKVLESAGSKQLQESSSWQNLSSGLYHAVRNDSSLIAFNLPGGDLSVTGIRMVGAHTDSPCLKVKPKPEKSVENMQQLGVEVYGGALLNPWFDRDLSLAGRVTFTTSEGELKSDLVNFQRAVVTIPSLAIHLDREVNNNRSINPQQHLPALITLGTQHADFDFRSLLKEQLIAEKADRDIDEVLDYEISLYDCQMAAITGLNNDFITSARLDNLLSCYTGLIALLESNKQHASLLICSDHEEVGSMSSSGAQGSFLESVLIRLTQSSEAFHQMISASSLISADNTHAIHPNYMDKHDAEHGPLLNHGPVIKTNANQRYASNSKTSAKFRNLCKKVDVPVQDFVVRTDMACGSTIGPITASNLGVETIDVGVPSYAMHSIREMVGSHDAYLLKKVLTEFYNNV